MTMEEALWLMIDWADSKHSRLDVQNLYPAIPKDNFYSMMFHPEWMPLTYYILKSSAQLRDRFDIVVKEVPHGHEGIS